jgi:hypothetical protein
VKPERGISLWCKRLHRVLIVSVTGYGSRGPGFDSQHYHLSRIAVVLERGPLSFVRIIEELQN